MLDKVCKIYVEILIKIYRNIYSELNYENILKICFDTAVGKFRKGRYKKISIHFIKNAYKISWDFPTIFSKFQVFLRN